ncbi:hypothetical protein ACTOS9_21225 [Bacillus subtilis]|uniref:Uncharacterized protein n=1 Tax=Bacillus subtilis TaxID=1423 RepID=A0AAX3RLK8_BACIU|nr:hypothetical protein P5633_03575 [Bacillus subtilis]WGD62717.1 hypothetical protein P5648_21440 [Bacillus subtilis]WGD71468.1 hypothetical protein P5645_01070 [Bacillus subtilis]WGD75905.1 hypothetical protein P5631_22090 [Bacillus subtilis]
MDELIKPLSTSKVEGAKLLLKRAIRYQAELSQSSIAHEVIDRATPVVWFGNASSNNWVTIATNPSSKEFLDRDDNLLLGEKSRFYVRKKGISLEEYEASDKQLETTIEMYNSYFERDTAYRGWFGKKNGARLEGFLNGMGGSLYSNYNKKRVVHTDFFPIPTRSQMSRIRQKASLLESQFAKDFIKDTLDFLSPSLIIVLGKEHCSRLALEKEFSFDSIKPIKDFPDSKYQVGFYHPLGVPVVSLHFKPSEQFIGLGGNKADLNGKGHGDYAKKASLNQMGNEVLNEVKVTFPNYSI